MPLVYQGRLLTRRVRGPGAALAAAGAIFERATHGHRLDLRLAWDSPEAFERCAAELPADFAGFWLDIAAEPDPHDLDSLVDLARRLRGGQITVACTVPGRENEVTLRLDGPEALRLDAERLDPHRQHLHPPRMTVRYGEAGERIGLGAERRALAAARTRAAADVVGLDADGRRAVFVDDPRIPPAEARWLGIEPASVGPGLVEPGLVESGLGAAPEVTPITDLDALKGAVVEDTPFGLQAELCDADARIALWCRWAGLLDRIDLIVLRCMGPRPTIDGLLDRFALHRGHAHHPHQSFGLYTAHHPRPLPAASLQRIIKAPRGGPAVVEWGLRWSALRLKLDGPLDQAEGPARSFFVVRTERDRIYDSLHLTLETEDPATRTLRAARRQLAADFGGLVEQPSAWQYVGPTLDSAPGQRYEALRRALAELAPEVLAEAPPIAGETPGRPGWLGRVVEQITRPGADPAPFDLTASFDRALSAALPGFRLDRQAHLTDRYFIAFGRRASHGVHLILLRRLHAPDGFRISVGVSTVPLPLADLDPGTGRSAPGLALPLHTLVPERADLDWRYAGHPSAERAVADAVAVLAARAGPFFAAADPVLAAYASDEEPAP